jgi:hypothetical protein
MSVVLAMFQELLSETKARKAERTGSVPVPKNVLVRYWEDTFTAGDPEGLSTYLLTYASAKNGALSTTVASPMADGKEHTGTWRNVRVQLRRSADGKSWVIVQTLVRTAETTGEFTYTQVDQRSESVAVTVIPQRDTKLDATDRAAGITEEVSNDLQDDGTYAARKVVRTAKAWKYTYTIPHKSGTVSITLFRNQTALPSEYAALTAATRNDVDVRVEEDDTYSGSIRVTPLENTTAIESETAATWQVTETKYKDGPAIEDVYSMEITWNMESRIFATMAQAADFIDGGDMAKSHFSRVNGVWRATKATRANITGWSKVVVGA